MDRFSNLISGGALSLGAEAAPALCPHRKRLVEVVQQHADNLRIKLAAAALSGNAAACELLGIPWEEIPWRTMDDFTAPGERKRLEDQWGAFLASGGAEGWYQLYVPDRGPIPVEFSATANVLPARHLSVFIPPDRASAGQAQSASAYEPPWAPVAVEGSGRLQLSEREREVMTLVASGLQSGEIAERLFLSPETVKSHVHSALAKLGAHTRAHGVAIALVTGQITWEV